MIMVRAPVRNVIRTRNARIRVYTVRTMRTVSRIVQSSIDVCSHAAILFVC